MVFTLKSIGHDEKLEFSWCVLETNVMAYLMICCYRRGMPSGWFIWIEKYGCGGYIQTKAYIEDWLLQEGDDNQGNAATCLIRTCIINAFMVSLFSCLSLVVHLKDK